MCGKEFPVGRGVGESDLVFAQVRAVYEVVPVREKVNDALLQSSQ